MADLFPTAVPSVSLDAQIAEVEREIKLRQRVYPRWIDGGRLSKVAADRQVVTMQAALATLRGLKEGQ